MKQKSTDKKADAPQQNNEDTDDQETGYNMQEEERFNPDNTLLEFHLKNLKTTNSSQKDYDRD